MMLILVSIIVIIGLGIFLFLQSPKFGRLPKGDRMERVNKSPNYRDGQFRNLSETPQITSDKNYIAIMAEFLFKKNDNLIPKHIIPSTKTDLLSLNKSDEVLVWFGHSSYFIQSGGKSFIVDPVFSKAGSPVSFYNKAFDGTNPYSTDDIPAIDYLIITHDHWDYLDYPTVKGLREKTGKVICSLGVGEHFEYWGFAKDRIIELDWNEHENLDEGFKIFCLPARHFSGRGLSPKRSLWASFMLETPQSRIYIGGDSGYDTHFHEIGKRFGTVDLAILENGQYDNDWKYIHMMPDQVLKASEDLNSKSLFPIHSGKFALANHSWDEPLKKITELNQNNIRILTPIIGERVDLNDTAKIFGQWWLNVD